MKVCIISLNIYSLFDSTSKSPMGGAELDMYTTAIGLEKHFDVSIITGDWGQRNIEYFKSIKVYKSLTTEKNILNYITAPFKLVHSLFRSNADIYITSGAGIEVGILALFCKLNKKKYIYRTASIIDCDGSYIKSHKFKGIFYKYGLINADRIITSVKQHAQTLIDRYPILNNKINHINLGIMPTTSTTKRDNILWVGRCDYMKKPEIYLDLAKKLQNYDFTMICTKQKHNEIYFDKIKNLANTIPNVKFINYIPFKDIQRYFNESKIFINTSDFEGFTYTLIQCGFAKTPVLYLNVNPDKVITNYDLGYFSNGDLNKLTKQIHALMTNHKDWKIKSNNILKYVRQNHDISIVGPKWKKVLFSLQ